MLLVSPHHIGRDLVGFSSHTAFVQFLLLLVQSYTQSYTNMSHSSTPKNDYRDCGWFILYVCQSCNSFVTLFVPIRLESTDLSPISASLKTLGLIADLRLRWIGTFANTSKLTEHDILNKGFVDHSFSHSYWRIRLSIVTT